jgi:hypothetical protein
MMIGEGQQKSVMRGSKTLRMIGVQRGFSMENHLVGACLFGGCSNSSIYQKTRIPIQIEQRCATSSIKSAAAETRSIK